MRISIVCPSAPYPIGGVVVLYEVGNALSRRGHEVTLVHTDFYHCRIESLADLDWFEFAPGVRHHHAGRDPLDLRWEMEPADVLFGTGAPKHLGLPVLLLQGVEMLLPELEVQGFRLPCLKICVASWLVDVATSVGVPAEQCRVVPLGIDLDRYRATVPPEDRAPSIAVLYNAHPAKGWAVALRVLHEVHRRRPEVAVRAFGTSEPPGDLPGWISFHLDPPVGELVDDVYNASQVFLQASDYEGFGFTAVEAMACGCALVTTDNGGSRDYAFHGETALVAAPGDDATLAEHVLRLLDEPELRGSFIAAGTALVSQLDWEHTGAQIEAFLEEYVADPAAFQAPVAPGVEAVAAGVQGDWVRTILRHTSVVGSARLHP